MTEDIEITLRMLERALEIEQEGLQFYLKAAQTTEDDKGKEMFATLADDEAKHQALIERQRNA